ncbi:hypothetical protein BDN67DRAFT_983860 [Paxillus ammoniavirescens]|nr:hypothetical protein BDN67DRAFT_983860 [Paxillus ammoniavirescens]
MARDTAPCTPRKSVKAPTLKGSAKKITKSNKENLNHAPTKKARVMVHWTKATNHHITDTLLTLIENSATWKGTFGFDKGVKKDPTPTGKGKCIIQHCADIVKVLFSTGEKNFKWTKDDLVHLRGMVKNRVMSQVFPSFLSILKATYSKYCNKLGETGHGLVVGGHEDELHAGSDIANVYNDIQLKFLWYLHMHALMGTSPVTSQKAISNSKLEIDLTVLGGENSEGKDEDETSHRTSTPMEDEDMPPGSSHPPSPDMIHWEDSDDNNADITPIKVTIPTKRAAGTPVASGGSVKKCQTPQDLVKEVADAERETRLAMSTANARECTVREQIKCQSAHDTAIAVERLHIDAHDKQAAASCAHELLILDRQIELARINAGFHVPGPIDPQLQ